MRIKKQLIAGVLLFAMLISMILTAEISAAKEVKSSPTKLITKTGTSHKLMQLYSSRSGGIAKSKTKNATYEKKVVKVTHKYKMKKTGMGGANQKVVLYGKAKDGKVVWKFSSPYCACTELSNNDYFINKNVIYLFSTRLYAINKSTGKVKWTYDYEVGNPSTAFDKKGNLYCTGTYESSFICISSKGKLKFEANFLENYHWPYKIEIVSGKIRVYIENFDDEKQYYLIYNKKGKYLGRHIVA